jgi:glutathione S-transferase
MLELYHYSNSICSERARMALHEKGVTDWVCHHVDLFKGEQFDPDYIKLNPKAQTPTLVHNGNVIRESSIICEYIDDAFDGPPLKPDDPIGIAQMREWIKTCDDQIYESVASLSFMSIFRRVLADMGKKEKEKHFRSQTDLSRVMRQRSCVEEGIDSPYVVRGSSNLLHLIDDLEAHLADGRKWIMGEQYTLAEINYSPFLARIEALDLLDLFMADKPLATAWWRHCTRRESYRVAEVGPRPGNEADQYLECGRATRGEVSALIDRIRMSAPYDLANQ